MEKLSTKPRGMMIKILLFVPIILLVSVIPVASGCSQGEQQQICFVSRGTGEAYDDIYVINADGSKRRNLTNSPFMEDQPSWSPDSKQIAFVSQREGDLGTEIYAMGADGRNQRALTHNKGLDYFPRWSPDGKRIAFTTGEGMLTLMNADGTNQVSLGRKAGYYVWSPDGKNIAFDSDGCLITVMLLEVGHTFWTADEPCDLRPTWSPDGTKIAYISNKDGKYEIYIMGSGGKPFGKVTNFKHQAVGDRNLDIVEGVPPSWSPDGKRIAFCGKNTGGYDIYVINADGSNLTNVTNNPPGIGVTGQLAWSPDGKKIAFVRDEWMKESGIIYVMDADGSNATRLTPSGSHDSDPAWRPK